VLLLVLLVLLALPAGAEAPEMPADYYAEPANLPFDEQPIAKGQEAGWHWSEFLYTSIIYKDKPVRVHAIYCVPDGVDAAHKAPAIIATHGADTGIRGTAAAWYWHVVTVFAKAGYCVLFFDWDFKPTPDWKTEPLPMVKRFTDYGALDFRKTGYFSKENDFRDGLHYQAMMAGRRGISWLLQQPEVDGANLAAFGSSYGGIFSSLLFAIDPRLKAANPEVFTTDYGLKEESYNMLPGGWTEADAQAWKARFDSFVLLPKRQGPILYTVGANDPTFLLTKAQRIFAVMPEPKHILIGPNRGHDYWDLDQSVLFFDEVLKGKAQRPAIRDMRAAVQGREVVVSAVADRAAKMEVFQAPVFEIDPDRGPDAIPPDAWTWTAVPMSLQDGRWTARFPLPVMRLDTPVYTVLPEDAPEGMVVKQPAPDNPLYQGQARLFVRATGANSAMECSPLLAPLSFSDPESSPLKTPWLRISTGDTLRINPSLTPGAAYGPEIEAVAVQKEHVTIAINALAQEGTPAAMLPTFGPVGTHGYVLWNWRQKPPSTSVAIDNITLPTKRIFPPFTDTIKPDSFTPMYWAYNACGGFTTFTLYGIADEKAYHGAIRRPGCGSVEELPIAVTDDKEHRLTLVMPACRDGACNMRVSLIGKDGAVTVRYRHTADRDTVLRFRFTGSVTLRLQMTSQPKVNWMTLVGPGALFFD
jgi:dienelactone hydrolase